MQGKTKVSVSVHTDLLREVHRVAGEMSRSAVFEQALASWLRTQRQVGLDAAVELGAAHTLGVDDGDVPLRFGDKDHAGDGDDADQRVDDPVDDLRIVERDDGLLDRRGGN